jgi:hypothetical protein
MTQPGRDMFNTETAPVSSFMPSLVPGRKGPGAEFEEMPGAGIVAEHEPGLPFSASGPFTGFGAYWLFPPPTVPLRSSRRSWRLLRRSSRRSWRLARRSSRRSWRFSRRS